MLQHFQETAVYLAEFRRQHRIGQLAVVSICTGRRKARMLRDHSPNSQRSHAGGRCSCPGYRREREWRPQSRAVCSQAAVGGAPADACQRGFSLSKPKPPHYPVMSAWSWGVCSKADTPRRDWWEWKLFSSWGGHFYQKLDTICTLSKTFFF